MPTFTVSLIASIPVSAQVVIEADNKEQALAIAQQMHSRAQLGWTYNGLPIPAFTGPVASVWSNPGVIAPPGPKKVSIVLAVSPTTVPFGSPVIATATIAAGATGLVSFYDGLTLIGTATPNGFGIATLSGVDLPIGVQQIVAKFAGDTYFAAGTSNTVQVVVTPPATATVCVGSPNPQDFGSVVNISATTTSAFGTPTGLILFYDGATQIGSAALSGGTCSINTAALLIGTHQLTAVYQGSPGFAGSTSPPFMEVIQAVNVPTMTVVVSSQPSAPVGTSVTFTATVSSLAGPPNVGAVTFVAIPMSGPPITIGTQNVNGSGVATISTSSLLSGTYTIQATYNGSSGFLSSVGTTAQDVLAAAPTEAITVTPPGPNGDFSDNGVTFSVNMTLTGSPTPTGTVTAYYGLSSSWPGDAAIFPGGSGLTLTGGVKNFSTNSSGITPGTYTAGYSYSGDSNWASTPVTSSPTATFVVYSNVVSIAITVTPDSINDLYSGNLTLQATVTGAGATPTGSVTFYAGSVSGWPGSGSAIPGSTTPLVGGVATYVHAGSGLTDGVTNLSCSYTGDANYSAVGFVVPTPETLTVVNPFNIVNSTSATTSGSTLTDTSVNFLAGGEYTVQVDDQVIMTATGNNYQVVSVGTNTLTVQSVGTPINHDGGPFETSDVGSGLSYIIQSSNISPNQFWNFGTVGLNSWVATVQQGTGTAPTPTGTMFFHYFQPELSHAGYWVQLGQISNVTNDGGLIQISTAGFTTPASDTLDLPHGFQTGDQVVIAGVSGVPANGTWTVTVIDSVTFDLQGSTFSGSYVSGGTTAHIMSGGSATFMIDENGASPFGQGESGLKALSVCYNGDSNYNASPNPNNDASLPTGAPQMGSVNTVST